MPAEIRRARRTDYTAVMALLAASGRAVPPPDRSSLRRFRGLVADLGTDLYLALVDGTLAGVLHVTYSRQLASPPRARLEQLVIAPSHRRQQIGTALLGFGRARAEKRGCGLLECSAAADAAASSFLLAAGFTVGAESRCVHSLALAERPTPASETPPAEPAIERKREVRG